MIEIACIVDIGAKRASNDDRALVNNTLITHGLHEEICEDGCLTIVCDGCGGVAFGHEAAELVAKTFMELERENVAVNTILETLKKANDTVISAQGKNYDRRQMATTIAGLYIYEDDFIVFNIGDSRVYRYRSPYIKQLSRDHSVMQQQIDLGLTPEPGSENVLTQCIGGECDIPTIVDGTGWVLGGDVYIICTDGVWGVLDENDFETVLGRTEDPSEISKQLIKLAIDKGTTDNLSVIVVRRVAR